MTEDRDITRRRVQDAVNKDWKPVRPLLQPGYRLLLLLPPALIALWFAAAEPRMELGSLGPVWGWGLTALQWMSGVLILAAALRQAVPGSRGSVRALAAVCGLVTALLLLIVVATFWKEPTVVPPGKSYVFWYECLLGPLELGFPVLGLALLLVMRAHPTRPAVVGGMCGLAAGVFTESGWRMYCWVSAPSHVFSSHIFAVALLACAGAVAATAIDHFRSRRMFTAR